LRLTPNSYLAWHWICSYPARLTPPSTKELKMGDQIQRLKDDPKEQQKKDQAEDKDQRQNSEQPVDEDDSGPSE